MLQIRYINLFRCKINLIANILLNSAQICIVDDAGLFSRLLIE